MTPELIVMLTNNDKTVIDAVEVFESCKDLPVQKWGFKDVGLIGASVISVGREVFIPDGLAVEIFKAAGTYVSAGILVIALILSFKKVHPIIIIILSAILGIAAGYIA